MKRLVSTLNLPKEDWLRYRKCGIAGTDAGAILGLNPYRSAFQVYHDKISDTIENIDNEAMRQGRDLEDYVAQRFTEATGLKVRRANAIYQSDEHPLLLADFDRLIVGQKAGLECKTVSPFSADKWANGKIPAHYLAQVDHYLAGCDIISRDAYARLKLLSRWDKIDQLSDAELDEMAWELNIQWYDSTAPIAAKRAVIRNSDRVYAKLGTPYAVEQIVADYFGTGEVREWYQYGGQPHHFKVLSDNPSLVNSNLDLFLKLLRTVKRRSSWLDAILICLTGEMFLYSGMAVRDHTQEVHVMGSDEIHIYHAAVVHDNNRETVSIGTDAAVISD